MKHLLLHLIFCLYHYKNSLIFEFHFHLNILYITSLKIGRKLFFQEEINSAGGNFFKYEIKIFALFSLVSFIFNDSSPYFKNSKKKLEFIQ